MTQMLGLLSRVQGIWDSLIMAFFSFMDVSSSSQTWTSFDCLYDLPDDNPTTSKAYYRTLVVFLQPVITVLLILLCAALVWCVKSAIYSRQIRKASKAAAAASGPSASGYSVTSNSTHEPSVADLTSMRDDDGSVVSSTTTTSETPYAIQSSMALSMQMGKPLPSLVRYVRKYIVLTVSTVVLYFYSTVTVQLMALFSCKEVDRLYHGGVHMPYWKDLRAVGTHWSQVGGIVGTRVRT